MYTLRIAFNVLFFDKCLVGSKLSASNLHISLAGLFSFYLLIALTSVLIFLETRCRVRCIPYL